MQAGLATALALVAAFAGCAGGRARLRHPPFPKVGQVDVYHGISVADPHRGLETPDSPETRAWIEAQNARTAEFLGGIGGRHRIRRRLEAVWDYERWSVPVERGGRYFFERNDGLEDQAVLLVADALPPLGTAGPAHRVLLDPNTLSGDGTVALHGYAVSEDGRRLAYQLADAGSDWVTVRVRDVDTGRDLPDRLEWVKFSGLSWARDGSGFYYSRYDAPQAGDELKGRNYWQKLAFHRLGTPQADDVVVCERKDEKEWGFAGDVTEDGSLLVIHVWRGAIDESQVYYRELASPEAPVVELITGFDADYEVLGNIGRTLLIRTDLDAPRGRVVAVDLDDPGRDRWRTVVPEADIALRGASLVGGTILAEYLEDARTVVRRFAEDGTGRADVELPGVGTADGFAGRRDRPETFFRFESFTTPPGIWRYDVATGRTEPVQAPTVGPRRGDYLTEQVFVTSKDGTRLPMFVTRRKDLRADPARPLPVYMYGYGGFNVSLTPVFSPLVGVWLELGGVFAQPTLRGGGEYGEAWHEAGMGARKQNVFDDFVAAAEHLVHGGLTSPGRLAIAGASNGGLLVGACMTQRPELFGAALPAVGVMDMLRFPEFTIGWAWVPEYGDPKGSRSEFDVLRAYSPLHNIRPDTAYPPTLITTADHDDRVFPAHSFKFAAALQEAQSGPAPILIRVETRAGHGAGTPTSKRIEEAADKLAFAAHALGVEVPEDFGD